MDKRTKNRIERLIKCNEKGLLNESHIDTLLKIFDEQKRYDISGKIIKKFLSYVENVDNLYDAWKKLLTYIIENRPLKSTDGLYNVQYISLLRNIPKEDAEIFINKLKKSKATSKEKFIERHGEELGTKKFEKFQETSVKWIKELKETLTEDEFKDFYRSRSWTSVTFWIKRGLSEEDAKKRVSEEQRKNSGCHREYYLMRGYSDTEIEEIFEKINKKKSAGKKYYIKKYGDKWKEKWIERISKYKKTVKSISDVPEFSSYKKEVNKHTQLSVFLNDDKIPNIEKRGSCYDLDHIYSIKSGFLNNVDPCIIGHYTNLRVIERTMNRSKRCNCDKTLEELYEDFYRNENESCKS